jgi:beta-1,4-mannosyl-glycoprotein beta-1,4-N-acetylglucosaminyltransferase
MVYDCFIFFNELDLLEIRLNELNEVVDKFVLVEADRTFQNNSKPYYFEENKERFERFLDKIIHIKLDKYPLFIPIINSFTPWKLEFFQRNSIVKGLVDCKPDDIIIISDVDEIPRAKVLQEMISNGVHQIYGLKMNLYLYFLNNQLIYDKDSLMSIEQSKDGIWHCTAVLPYRLLKLKPNAIRRIIMRTRRKGEVFKIIPNGGWHFSYIGGVDKIIEKLEAFSHSEFNNETFKSKEKIAEYITTGKDLFGRDLKFELLTCTDTLPMYLQENENDTKFSNYFYTNNKSNK